MTRPQIDTELPRLPSVAQGVRPRRRPRPTPRSHARVLVVDDDDTTRALLSEVLGRHGLDVIEAPDAASGLRALFARRPDMVVLDLQLPDLHGRSLLHRIRELTDVPVMVVTADCDEASCVETLRAGADDFMPKPFGVQVLLARVEALLRRAPAQADESSRYTDALLDIDLVALEVRAGGRHVPLTPLQLRLLTALVQHRGQVLSAEQLLKLAWDDDRVPRERVKLYVGYLRSRFRDAGVELPVQTVRGFGYRYRPPAGS